MAKALSYITAVNDAATHTIAILDDMPSSNDAHYNYTQYSFRNKLYTSKHRGERGEKCRRMNGVQSKRKKSPALTGEYRGMKKTAKYFGT